MIFLLLAFFAGALCNKLAIYLGKSFEWFMIGTTIFITGYYSACVLRSYYQEIGPRLLNIECRAFWVNLGCWEAGVSEYDGACRCLARKLGKHHSNLNHLFLSVISIYGGTILSATAAELSENDIVLDVGFGFGEQIIFWMKNFSVEKVVGINISKSETRFAREHVKHQLTAAEFGRISLQTGDACSMDVPNASMTKVLALDSAYHFNPRTLFFKEAFRCLKPGGKIALVDICLCKSPGELLPWTERLICLLTGIPTSNMYPKQNYLRHLRAAGFTSCTAHVIPCVFGGFADFVNQHYICYGGIINDPRMWIQFWGTAWLLQYVSKKNMLECVLFAACKPAGGS